jgi:Family of unknown function (DUF6129)
MLETATIERIAARVTAQGLDETTLQALRADWPELRFTHCSDDDICGPAPCLQTETFNLYLLDAREHCVVLTTEPALACGVVLAAVESDVD